MPACSVGLKSGLMNGLRPLDDGGGVAGGCGWFLLVDVGLNDAASDTRMSTRYLLLLGGGDGGGGDGGGSIASEFSILISTESVHFLGFIIGSLEDNADDKAADI